MCEYHEFLKCWYGFLENLKNARQKTVHNFCGNMFRLIKISFDQSCSAHLTDTIDRSTIPSIPRKCKIVQAVHISEIPVHTDIWCILITVVASHLIPLECGPRPASRPGTANILMWRRLMGPFYVWASGHVWGALPSRVCMRVCGGLVGHTPLLVQCAYNAAAISPAKFAMQWY